MIANGIDGRNIYVESPWFDEIVSGRSAERGKRSMQVDQSIFLAALRSECRAACDPAAEQAGRPGLTPHERRHTAASLAAQVAQEDWAPSSHTKLLKRRRVGQDVAKSSDFVIRIAKSATAALGRRQLAAARRLHPTGRTCRGLRSRLVHSFLLEGQSEGSESVVQA
jgi:hypothetical protein